MKSATTPAQAATTAETRKASVKPWSVAMPATALAARIVAEVMAANHVAAARA